VLTAAALSAFGILAFWSLGDLEGDVVGLDQDDPEALVEESASGGSRSESERSIGGGASASASASASATRRRFRLGVLALGIATRVLLGALGMIAMARVVADREVMRRGSFIAVEVLGWILM
jgi:hypothetical protein